jgi:RNA polymerase sigma-70 factor (ECF subfamily)
MSSRQQKDSHESSGTPTSPDTAAHDELDGMLSAVALLRDRVAFETFYRRTSPKIFAICLKVLRDRSEAEDTLQDVYVTAWNHAATFNPQLSSALTWLGTIARNRAIDRIRRRRTQPLDEASAEEIVDDAPTPAALAQLSQKGSGSNAACRPCPTRREA